MANVHKLTATFIEEDRRKWFTSLCEDAEEKVLTEKDAKEIVLSILGAKNKDIPDEAVLCLDVEAEVVVSIDINLTKAGIPHRMNYPNSNNRDYYFSFPTFIDFLKGLFIYENHIGTGTATLAIYKYLVDKKIIK